MILVSFIILRWRPDVSLASRESLAILSSRNGLEIANQITVKFQFQAKNSSSNIDECRETILPIDIFSCVGREDIIAELSFNLLQTIPFCAKQFRQTRPFIVLSTSTICINW